MAIICNTKHTLSQKHLRSREFSTSSLSVLEVTSIIFTGFLQQQHDFPLPRLHDFLLPTLCMQVNSRVRQVGQFFTSLHLVLRTVRAREKETKIRRNKLTIPRSAVFPELPGIVSVMSNKNTICDAQTFVPIAILSPLSADRWNISSGSKM